MLLDCYVEIIYVVLSIPIIYILYVSYQITKETKKRERDKEYCKSDIMESETLRYYVSYGDRKILLNNIRISAILFLIIIGIILCLLLVYPFNTYTSFEPLEQVIIFTVFMVIGSVLIYNINKLRKEDTIEYENNITKIIKHLDKRLLGLTSFSKLEKSLFLKPFIERWTSLQKTHIISTYSKKIRDIDTEFLGTHNKFTRETVKKLIGFVRPSTNLFLEKNELNTDLFYLYDELNSTEQNISLPELTKYNNYSAINAVEVTAWILLVFIYYNIYHIYRDTDMFVEIITAFITVIIISMMIYYITIAKDIL